MIVGPDCCREHPAPVVVADDCILELDKLPRQMQADYLFMEGLRQPHLDQVARCVSARRVMVLNSKLDSLDSLSRIHALKELGIVGCRVSDGLGFLGSLSSLRVLLLFDVQPLADLESIATARGLVGLSLCGGFTRTLRLETVEPLARLRHLRELELLNVRLPAGGVRALEACRELRHLSLSDQHDFSDFAYLAATLPAVEQTDLSPFWVTNEDAQTVRIRGRRKPELSAVSDADRIAKYVAEYERLKMEYARLIHSGDSA